MVDIELKGRSAAPEGVGGGVGADDSGDEGGTLGGVIGVPGIVKLFAMICWLRGSAL
jgi:hypothetical protein